MVGVGIVADGASVDFRTAATGIERPGMILQGLLQERFNNQRMLSDTETRRLVPTLEEAMDEARRDFKRYGAKNSPSMFDSTQMPGYFVRSVLPEYPHQHPKGGVVRFDIAGHMSGMACGEETALVVYKEADGFRKAIFFTGPEVNALFQELVGVTSSGSKAL